ncbi:MAG TPA: divalent-cation tolerance protein CutA [Candidatus Elarobacter sp.]|nr:divalent-cation tolerance protein CutA [Candidatus Elarobacter sp.]
MSHADAVVVLTTIGTENDAATLVRALLERRLIACGTIIPRVRSIYRWEEKIADETEVVLLLKTRSATLDALEQAFESLHPYKLPELLVLPVAAGLPKYLAWIADETGLAIT